MKLLFPTEPPLFKLPSVYKSNTCSLDTGSCLLPYTLFQIQTQIYGQESLSSRLSKALNFHDQDVLRKKRERASQQFYVCLYIKSYKDIFIPLGSLWSTTVTFTIAFNRKSIFYSLFISRSDLFWEIFVWGERGLIAQYFGLHL